MNTYKYSDCSIPIPHWPFWGKPICEIKDECILKADEKFKELHPECCKKGNMLSTISVSIDFAKKPK